MDIKVFTISSTSELLAAAQAVKEINALDGNCFKIVGMEIIQHTHATANTLFTLGQLFQIYRR